MADRPSAERGSVEQPQACCAHLRVVYRTEDVRMMVEATELSPGGMHTLTHGWWECSDCAARFALVSSLQSPPPAPRAAGAGEVVAWAKIREIATELHRAILTAHHDRAF